MKYCRRCIELKTGLVRDHDKLDLRRGRRRHLITRSTGNQHGYRLHSYCGVRTGIQRTAWQMSKLIQATYRGPLLKALNAKMPQSMLDRIARPPIVRDRGLTPADPLV